jgi:hypothetical protein
LAPVFTLNPFNLSSVTAGQAYGGTIATDASDLDGDSLTFAKVSGPAWLSVAANGGLSGTPLSADVGTNSFVVSVADVGGLSNTATMNLTVNAAPAIFATVSPQLPNLLLNWTGGIAPYQVQMNTDLTSSAWVSLAGPLSSTSLVITPSNNAAFYRILGQ